MRQDDQRCLTLIGIAGAGKSTLGRLLSGKLGWAHVDTDMLMEAYYGVPLQQIMDDYGLEKFLELEEHQVANIGLTRSIISTGGSVIYSKKALRRLKALGPVVYLEVSLESFVDRVGGAEGRALAIGGKTREELFAERAPLYAAAADFTVRTDHEDPETCARAVLEWFQAQN